MLRKMGTVEEIESGGWLGDDIPSLFVGDTEILPYLIGDCAFRLSLNIMRTCSKDGIKRNLLRYTPPPPSLLHWVSSSKYVHDAQQTAPTLFARRVRLKILSEGPWRERALVEWAKIITAVQSPADSLGDNGKPF